jgi:hypothetical protein
MRAFQCLLHRTICKSPCSRPAQMLPWPSRSCESIQNASLRFCSAPGAAILQPVIFATVCSAVETTTHPSASMVEALLETLISKYEICVVHLQAYKTIWKQQILPRQEQQAKDWKPSPFEWSNPYGPASITHNLASLKALSLSAFMS